MIKILTVTTALTVSACATTSQLMSDDSLPFAPKYEYGEFCPRIPGAERNPDRYNQAALNGLDFAGDNLEKRLELPDEKLTRYAHTISYDQYRYLWGGINCWTGQYHNYAEIGNLKNEDVDKIRIVIGTLHEGIGYKCKYSENNNYWRAKTCPTKPEGSVG